MITDMKNRFLQGVLSGALVVTIVFTLLFTGYVNERKADATDGSKNKTSSVLNEKVEAKVNKLQSLIDTYYLNEVEQEKMVDGIYKGLLGSLGDPYSVYYTKDEFASLMESSSGSYCGIGAYVNQNMNTGIITIVKPFKGSPAEEAGILPGDIVYKVMDEEVTGKDLSAIVSKMKGKEGTSVKMEVIREGEKDPIKVTVKRRQLEVPTIESEMLEDKIGYILVTEFDEVTDEQFRKAIKELESDGMKGLVIDLRNNPGGMLTTVCDMLDRILPKGIIVYTEDKNGKRTQEIKSTDKEVFNKPIAVLINGNSASASEVFAGAIQDYGVGTLVGTTSFGKGIVQSVIPLTDGTGIKITVSKYFTPKGRNIHGIGIEPDVKVELDEKLKSKISIEKSEDNQIKEAVKQVKSHLEETKK